MMEEKLGTHRLIQHLCELLVGVRFSAPGVDLGF